MFQIRKTFISTLNCHDCGLQLPSGQTYNITVVATNFLGYASEPLVHQFMKEASDVDFVVSLLGDSQIKPNGKIKLVAKVEQTTCSSVNSSSISVSTNRSTIAGPVVN